MLAAAQIHTEPATPAQVVSGAYNSMSEGCVVTPTDNVAEVRVARGAAKRKKHSPSQSSESRSRSRPRSDASENCLVETAIPCCRQRKCVCPKQCSTASMRACLDPCCCNPCVTTAAMDNVKLKEENLALRNCIKRVRSCAVAEACEIIKGVLGGCKCTCCKARTKLRPCKSLTTVPCRETWLCVPMPGSKRCGGYTPSGWSKLLKKCREQLATDPCGPCDFASCLSPCGNLRCRCLPPPRPCPPCPHLCPLRSLPPGLRPYTPCCPLYFPASMCCHGSVSPCGSAHSDKSQASYKSCSSGNGCRATAITAPPFRPKYTPIPGMCHGCPLASASVPGALVKDDPAAAIKSPTKTESKALGSASR